MNHFALRSTNAPTRPTTFSLRQAALFFCSLAAYGFFGSGCGKSHDEQPVEGGPSPSLNAEQPSRPTDPDTNGTVTVPHEALLTDDGQEPIWIPSERHRAMKLLFEQPSPSRIKALSRIDSESILATGTNTLYVMSRKDGRTLSKRSLGRRIVDGPAADGEWLWYLLEGGHLRAVQAAKPTSTVHKRMRLSGTPVRLLAVTSQFVMTVGATSSSQRLEVSSYLRRDNANRATSPEWSRTPQIQPEWPTTVTAAADRIVLTDRGRIVALLASTGVVRWMWRTEGTPAAGVVQGAHYEVFHRGKLVRIALEDGAVRELGPVEPTPTTLPYRFAGGWLYGSAVGLHALDDSGRQAWSLPIDADGSRIVVDGDWAWVIVGDRRAAVVDLKSRKSLCTMKGAFGLHTAASGNALMFERDSGSRLTAVGCRLSKQPVRFRACRDLHACCSAWAATDAQRGAACLSVLVQVVDMGQPLECLRATRGFARFRDAPQACDR